MVHSRKSTSNNLQNRVKDVLRSKTKQNCHLAVALSGGIDSVVLLHLLVTLSKQMQFTLSAVHINHGISSNAVRWSKFCRDLCHAYDIPITVTQLNIRKESGVSLEAAARYGRYQVFNHLTSDYVILAQHLDDQAETLLLQLLRGAGTKGLGAMPILRKQTSDVAPQILRPLLDVSRSKIEEYAKQNTLNWINDESNDNTVFDRNFLRHEILPLLGKRYPAYQKTLSRSSHHLAEASDLLNELAEIDSKDCIISGKLQVNKLRLLSIPRAKNLLRFTLSQQGATLPSTTKLDDMLHQLLSSRIDAQLHIPFGNTEVRCYQGSMYVLPRKPPPKTEWQITWQGEKLLKLDNSNSFINFSHSKNMGINFQKLVENPVTIRQRLGGERFCPDCKRPRRSLKNLLQEASIPPWDRKILPLLFSGDQLVWVPGIGVECTFQVRQEESGLVPIWQVEQ